MTECGIDLWVVPTGSNSVASPTHYVDILSEVELQRYRRFRLESERRRHLVSHVLLRMLLSRTTRGAVDPRCWRFTKNEYGKPAVDMAAGLPSLYFSLSHSERLVAVAISADCPVGIDVESLRRPNSSNPSLDLLSPGERSWLKSRPLTVMGPDFTRLWTVKEAYAKYLGRGLSLDFPSFEVRLDPVRLVRTELGEPQPSDLHLETSEIRMADGPYQLSLAARRPPVAGFQVRRFVLNVPPWSFFTTDETAAWTRLDPILANCRRTTENWQP